MRRLLLLAPLIAALACLAPAQKPNADLASRLLDLPAPAPTPPVSPTPPPRKFTYPLNAAVRFVLAPPDDEAPIDVLVEYWSVRYSATALMVYRPKPSARVVERLVDYCRDKPTRILGFLGALPPDPAVIELASTAHDSIGGDQFDYIRYELYTWLLHNSPKFVDDLERLAREVRDQRQYVTNHRQLLALAKIDWDRAEPIARKLLSDKDQPVASTAAKWVFYARAIRNGDDAEASKLRRQLQDTAEDRKASNGARDMALDALSSEGDWDGRDEWYVSLLGDESLYDLQVNGSTYTGLTTMVMYSPPGRFTAQMIRLMSSESPVVRRTAKANVFAAAANGEIEAARALLPILSQKPVNGLRDEEIRPLFRLAEILDLPEAVPHIIDAMNNYPRLLNDGVRLLTKYGDPQAVPILRRIVGDQPESPFEMAAVISALDACGGISAAEKVEGIEWLAINWSDRLAFDSIALTKDAPLAAFYGRIALSGGLPSDELAISTLDRIKALRRSNPLVAASMTRLIIHWDHPFVDTDIMARIAAGTASAEEIVIVISRGDRIREKNSSDLAALRSANGLPRGLAACLSNAPNDIDAVLKSAAAISSAKTTALACARLTRLALPVAAVAPFLDDRDPTVARAAELYLESEDSQAARRLVLARHPGEALLLGARAFMMRDDANPSIEDMELASYLSVPIYYHAKTAEIRKFENAMREEVRATPGIEVVYGVISTQDTDFVLAYGDRIVLRHYVVAGRYTERTLTRPEFDGVTRAFMTANVDEAIPGSRGENEEKGGIELVMFSKQGGRRIYFGAGDEDKGLLDVARKITELRNDSMKVHYPLADKVAGVEVLLSDADKSALTFWKKGSDRRVLIEDSEWYRQSQNSLRQLDDAELPPPNQPESEEATEARRNRSQERWERARGMEYGWRMLNDSNKIEAETEPPSDGGLDARQWNFKGFDVIDQFDYWRFNRNGDSYVADYEGFRIERANGTSTLLKEAPFYGALVDDIGKWAVLTRRTEGTPSISRFDIARRREYPVELPEAVAIETLAYVPALGKFLVFSTSDYGYLSKRAPSTAVAGGAFYLVDALTGTVNKQEKGEFRPLLHQTFRPLQPTGRPSEFWAAIYDEKTKETRVGRYDAAKFEFTPTTVLPAIELDSMDIWVDEPESKIYIVYEGDLLRVPLGKSPSNK